MVMACPPCSEVGLIEPAVEIVCNLPKIYRAPHVYD